MGVLLVVVAFLMVVRLVGLVLLIRSEQPSPAAQRAPRHSDPCLAPLMVLAPPPDPEQDLLDQLMSGSVQRDEYRTAMAALAERDARDHPLGAPPG
jgi:hypothetical protein